MPSLVKWCFLWFTAFNLAACGGGGGSGSGSSQSAQLTSLVLENVTLDQVFQSNQTDYTASATYMVSRTRVTATAETDDVQSISVNGEILLSGETSTWIDLNEGENTIDVAVTAANGVNTKNYHLTVYRLGVDASIKHLVPDSPELFNFFGRSVAFYGDTLAVGAYGTNGGGSDSGLVYIFIRHEGQWYQEQILSIPDLDTRFGKNVAIYKDTLAVSAPMDDEAADNAGAVYIYHRSELGWGLQTKLTPEAAAGGEIMGNDNMVLTSDTLVVGASADDALAINAGSVFIFSRDGDDWKQQAKLTAPDGATGDRFGVSVSFFNDWLAVGADRRNDVALGDNVGAVYVFNRIGSFWPLEQILTASDADQLSQFGNSVSMYGTTLAVAASLYDEPADNAGAVYIYQLENPLDPQWNEVAKLTATDANSGDRFGNAISLSGDRLAVGSYLNDEQAGDAGAVYLYEYSDSAWAATDKITLSGGVTYDFYGINVLIADNFLFSSTQNEDSGEGVLHVLE